MFGFDNDENKTNNLVNQFAGKHKLLSRIRLGWRTIFPSYIIMSNSPYYHFVSGRKWLLPAAWIFRGFRMITGKTPSLSEKMSKIMTPVEIINEREKELRAWGLIS